MENQKELKLSFVIKIPVDTNPLFVQDAIVGFIEQKNWKMCGGRVKYPDSDNAFEEEIKKFKKQINKN